MAKVAKLVYITLVTRVIVEDNLPQYEMLESVHDELKTKFSMKILNGEISENLEKITLDKVCPYGTFDSDILPDNFPACCQKCVNRVDDPQICVFFCKEGSRFTPAQ